MITQFEVGKKYRFIGDPKKAIRWTKHMEYLFKGEHVCSYAAGMYASFEDDAIPNVPWMLHGDEKNFKVVV